MSGSPSPADPSSIHVDIDDRQQAYPTKSATLARLLSAVLSEQHGEVTGEVGLAFIELDEMTELNRDHMGVDAPTDVLAFPIDAAPGRDPVPAGQPVMFGDIVICPEYASRAPQAFDDELALLVVHGALHLLGHDHAEPDETAVMKALEVDMLERFATR